jgi:pimeloyl-ACP methyl ester carboxylesterase
MNRFTHFELATTDLEKTAAFYRAVFGWKVDKWEGPVDYWLVSSGDASTPGINSGLMQADKDVVYPQLWEVDFRKQVTKLEVPVYFLIGRHDVNAPTVLVEEYYDLLEAPYKEIVWFEHSGHNPWVSESGRFVQVMVDTVLAQNP